MKSGIFMYGSVYFYVPVHVFRHFHGRERVFHAAIHVFGQFHGRETKVSASIHEFGLFCGWECPKECEANQGEV